MGMLVEGAWKDIGYGTEKSGGRFQRSETVFRNWVTPDGRPGPDGEGGFRAESGRYHLYVSYACPWAHRALIYRALKGLAPHIGVSAVHPLMLRDGWTFDSDFPGATGDDLYGLAFLRELYLKADPRASGRVTVPVLWDKERQTIVSNESSEIIRMFNSVFDGLTGNRLDFYPEGLRAQIDRLNDMIYEPVNNGVYKAGFATTQAAYDEAVTVLFQRLDELEALLADHRYLTGGQVTEADWRLWTTLLRFDPVYHTHFKCNRAWLREYPNLWGWTRELYQYRQVRETVRFDHILHHYYRSHPWINPHGIIPINPVIDWDAPHGRDHLPRD
ncbi:glutathione S-transferase family protein [uncultured Paracoccus sp.]|uniref:glutathione S-transferase family protein n=1 Tax=uncultured Paracoccus sp. TaxID=189685 RepID=UPI0025CF7BE1|nr:glutathione S-transferase family protein [uncultured Paracoccus sp.]